MKTRIKKNWKWLALGAALLVTTSVSAMAQSEQIGSAVSSLTQRYDNLVRIPDNDPISGGDLKVHCLSLVFQGWSKSYLDILDRTPIDPQSVGAPLTNFGRKWFNTEDNMKVAEYFRPGVTIVLTGVIEKLRNERGNPAKLDPAKMTLGDILDPVYFSNLKLCLDDEIVNQALPLLKPVDPTEPLPPGLLRNPHGSVKWEKSANNGIKPMWLEPVAGPANNSVGEIMGTVRGMTYQDYLNRMQNQ